MYLPSKIRFLSNESMTFLRISCLALMIVVILHYTKPFSTSSAAANSNYKYLVKVFDRSLAITQAGENFKATSKKNSPQLESDKLGFMVSYAPISSTPEFDAIAQKVAFTYDNAVAALAFMAVGDRERARQIVDTLVAAQKRDRYFQDGRIQNQIIFYCPANLTRRLIVGKKASFTSAPIQVMLPGQCWHCWGITKATAKKNIWQRRFPGENGSNTTAAMSRVLEDM